MCSELYIFDEGGLQREVRAGLPPRLHELLRGWRERALGQAVTVLWGEQKIMHPQTRNLVYTAAACGTRCTLQARFTAAVEIPQCLAVSAMLALFSFLQSATA